jgi:hypothetical protein
MGQPREPNSPRRTLPLADLAGDPGGLEFMQLAPDRLGADVAAELGERGKADRSNPVRGVAASRDVDADHEVYRVDLVGEVRVSEATGDDREVVDWLLFAHAAPRSVSSTCRLAQRTDLAQ